LISIHSSLKKEQPSSFHPCKAGGGGELFKIAVALIDRKEHLTPEGLQEIVNIKASMNLGLPVRLADAYPNSCPIPRPEVAHISSIDLN